MNISSFVFFYLHRYKRIRVVNGNSQIPEFKAQLLLLYRPFYVQNILKEVTSIFSS